jgi:hypothetical protein
MVIDAGGGGGLLMSLHYDWIENGYIHDDDLQLRQPFCLGPKTLVSHEPKLVTTCPRLKFPREMCIGT